MLTVGSLFSGIGGIDLGLERAGMKVQWQCEIDPFCRSILKTHWPNIHCYEDIHDVKNPKKVDLLAGGFPCQPVSVAGKRKAQSDPRWLWPEFARLISTVRPNYILVENVPRLLHRGLSIVLADLSSFGYDAEWDCIPAASLGAPHLRDRLFVVAYPSSYGREGGRANKQERKHHEVGWSEFPSGNGQAGEVAYSEHERLQRQWTEYQLQEGSSEAAISRRSRDVVDTYAERRYVRSRLIGATGRPQPKDTSAWSTKRHMGREVDGFSSWMDGYEAWECGTLRSVDSYPKRKDRIRALGNAVVPQVAQWIGEEIMYFEARRRFNV